MAQYPQNTTFNFDSNDILLIQFTPYRIIEQDSGNAAHMGFQKEPVEEPMILLAPLSFQDDVIHTWSNYDSLGTRIVEKGNVLEGLTKQVLGTAKGISMGQGFGKVVTQKLDVPMTFNDSNRRQISLIFTFADQGNTKTDVFEPVRKLQIYSCADKTDGFYDFDMPYIFTVETLNSDLLYIEHAALQSVQPTWFGPYRNGYPSKCELTVQIQDLDPLYRKTFNRNNASSNYQSTMAVK